ncbi:MAG: GMC oxidoreductase [Sandaracinaceae bacterium]
MSSTKRFGRIGRRNFVKLGAAGATGLYLTGCGGDPVERVQALVIGSGFGGSIAAQRLAEAGVGVTVLERGRRWEISEEGDTFCTTQAPDGRCAWGHREPVLPGLPPTRLRRSPYAGLLQRFGGGGIDVVSAAAVGGGSLVYSGLMLKPPRDLFEQVMPSDISYTEMDEVWYQRVLDIMQPDSMPDDVLAAEPYASSRIFIRDAELAGLEVERRIVAFDWDRIRAELAGDITAQCITGDYLYGLNSGAKKSIDRMGWLPAAEATGLVDVRPLHQVTSIGKTDEGRWYADVEIISESLEVLETTRIEADCLFMGAGSMNTTKLLLRAQRDMTITGLNDEIGNHWGNNGQRILARTNLSEDTGAEQGGPACIFLHHHDNPDSPIGMEFGPAPIGFESNSLVCATQGIPDQLGQLRLDADGEVFAEWDRSYDEAAGRAARTTVQTVVDATEGEVGTIPGLGDPNITFHPLGGVTLGMATDSFGRVRGQENLYVVDSSLIPGSTPAGNPFWTIAAIAERCMDTIIREDFATG